MSMRVISIAVYLNVSVSRSRERCRSAERMRTLNWSQLTLRPSTLWVWEWFLSPFTWCICEQVARTVSFRGENAYIEQEPVNIETQYSMSMRVISIAVYLNVSVSRSRARCRSAERMRTLNWSQLTLGPSTLWVWEWSLPPTMVSSSTPLTTGRLRWATQQIYCPRIGQFKNNYSLALFNKI